MATTAASKSGYDNREELIPEVGLLLSAPIHYRVHSNVQARNLVLRLSAMQGLGLWWQSMHLSSGTPPTMVTTMGTKGIYATVVN